MSSIGNSRRTMPGKAKLSAVQVEQYHRDGYVVFPAMLCEQELAALLAEIERASMGSTLESHDQTRMEMEPSQGPAGTSVRRLYEPCTHYASFRQLSESEKLLDCVEQLLGPDLEFHYSKINMKPPAVGSVVEWHQDLAFYPLTNSDSLAVLIYLDDADCGNGCLQVIPGLHHASPMSHSRNDFFQ